MKLRIKVMKDNIPIHFDAVDMHESLTFKSEHEILGEKIIELFRNIFYLIISK